MHQFGISDNGWRKLQAGQPLHQSVIERLIGRVADMDGTSHSGIYTSFDCAPHGE